MTQIGSLSDFDIGALITSRLFSYLEARHYLHLFLPHAVQIPVVRRLSRKPVSKDSKLKLKRVMSSAGFNAVLEPVDLDRADGKRPDGTIVFPYQGESSSFGILHVSTLFFS